MFAIIHLPQYAFAFDSMVIKKKTYLLVAGGRQPEAKWLQAIAQDKIIVCADKGVSYCKKAGIIPHYLFGDGDSAGADYDWAEQNGVQVNKYSAEKDQTDLQLALAFIASQKDVDLLLLTGIWGGRFDHAYSTLFSALAFSRQTNINAILLDEQEAAFLLCDKQKLSINFQVQPEVISVLPLTEVINVSLSGCNWLLEHNTIELKNPYAVSNRLQAGEKQLTFIMHAGMGSLYLCYC